MTIKYFQSNLSDKLYSSQKEQWLPKCSIITKDNYNNQLILETINGSSTYYIVVDIDFIKDILKKE